MNDSQQEQQAKQSNPPFLRSIILILLEIFVSFVIKHDRSAHAYAQPFIKKHLSVQFNTFLPSDIFYITFSSKGLFFEHFEPQHPKPQIFVLASSIDLLKILFLGNENSLKRIRLRGEEDLHPEFLMFLRSISLPYLLADWKNWFNRGDEKNTAVPKRHIEPLLQRIEEQQLKINKLNLQIKEYQYDLKTLKSKHKLHSRLYIFIIVFLCVSFGLFFWYNFIK